MENYHFEYLLRRGQWGLNPVLEWAETTTTLKALLKFVWDALVGLFFGMMLFGRPWREGPGLVVKYLHIELLLNDDWYEQAGITDIDKLMAAARNAERDFRRAYPEFARAKALDINRSLLEASGDTFKTRSPVLDLFDGVVDPYVRKLPPEDAVEVWRHFNLANLAIEDEAGQGLLRARAQKARSALKRSGCHVSLDQAIEAAEAVFVENLDKYIIRGRTKSSRGRAKKAGTVGLRWRLGEMFGERLMWDTRARLWEQFGPPRNPVPGAKAAPRGGGRDMWGRGLQDPDRRDETTALEGGGRPAGGRRVRSKKKGPRGGPHKYLGRGLLLLLSECEPARLAAPLPGDLAAVHAAARQLAAAGMQVTGRTVAERLGLHPGTVSRQLKKIREFLRKRE